MVDKQAIDPEIVDYIETKILPQYNSIGGHTDKHIHQVIERSLHFYEQKPELNINMVYVIAAYHDLGRLVDNKTHNIESARMLRADEFLAKHFTEDEIETMAEAVEDHRASLGHEPRSIYGKLVSSADRNTSIEMMLSRVFDYTKHLHPEMTEDEVIEEARFHLRRKYSPDGYAAKTMYFDDPDFAIVLAETERITRDPDEFRRIMKGHKRLSFPNGTLKHEKETFQKLACLGYVSDEDFKYRDDVKPKDEMTYCVRVLLVKDDQICVVKSMKYDYIQILGGHVEDKESINEAAKREAIEEGGYEVLNLEPKGYFIEDGVGKKSVSFVYVARPGKEVGTAYTQDEADCEFQPVWYTYQEALSIFSDADKQHIKSYNGRFAAKRDLMLMRKLMEEISNEN